MRNSTPNSAFQFLTALVFLFFFAHANAQNCDSLVPSFIVDLSASPNMSWTSPMISRDGNCCGTSSPDQCIEFIITLNPGVIAISFDITSGAIPPGALFYQVNCGPITPVGSPICLTGVGPHELTFCKPGNNQNEFSITSYSNPIIGPDITLNAGCQGYIFANYYNVASMTWTSIAPGPTGSYDYLLSCTSACDTTYITAPVGAPAYIDYLVCGDDIGGCNPLPICDTIRVNFVPEVQVSLFATQMALCAGATTTITATPSGGSSPYSILWSTSETSTSIITGPGTYYVEVLDLSGCLTATDTIVIVQNNIPAVNAGPDQTVCFGTSVTLSGSGANTYSWDNGVTNGVSFIPAIGTILYTVTGTDANGCINTDQVNVTANPMPVVNAGADQIICEGTSVILNGSGASTYAWDNGVTNGVSFVPTVGTVIYQVTGTDLNGCVDTDDVSVTVNPLPIVGAGPDQTVCYGTSVTLNGSGASSYAWDNGVNNGVAFVPPVGTTIYTVTGTDGNGCTNIDQASVTVNPMPAVNAGPDQQACAGSSIILSASGASSYNWDNGISDGVPFGQAVGTLTYSVIGTDANGCINTDQVDVTIFALPNVDAGTDQVVCEGTSVTLNGAGANVYIWNNGVNDGVPFIPAVGTLTYTVIGTDGNGCVNTDDAVVTVNPLPVVDAGPDQILCAGSLLTLSGSGAITYSWDNGVTNGIPFVQNIGTITYTITGTDANACSNTDQVDVLVNVLPNVSAGPDQIVCEGTLVVLYGSGASTYVWDNGVTNGVPFLQGVGTITYTVTGTDANGCSNIDKMDVTVNPLPVITVVPDFMECEGTPLVLTAIGSPNVNWNNGITNGVPFYQNVGIVTYVVNDSLNTGCTASDSVTIEIVPNPVVTTEDAEICEGEGVILAGQGTDNYSWTGGIMNGVEFFPNTSGQYTVTGTDMNGCSDQATANVIVNPAPMADFKILNLSLTTLYSTTGFDNLSSGAVSYVWDFGDGSSNSTEFEPIHEFPSTESGEYTITLTAYSDRGCPAVRIKYVHIFQDYTIYVPNTFTPNYSGVNDVFLPVMEGFDEDDYALYIYNRWGNLIFESHEMGFGWDGTFAKPGKQVQDNVYTWKIEARIKDSADSKLFIGHVTLLK